MSAASTASILHDPTSALRDGDNPKLAIIITCYNYESFVGRAIKSVLDQARPDCEIVVIDDGSADQSWEIIRCTAVPAFKINNSGQLAACIYGLDQTRAPFILFLDADDELKPGALDKIVEYLDPAVAKLQFSLTQVDAAGHLISGAQASLETFRSRDDLARRVLRTGVYKTPPTSGNVFRRDLCELLREVDYDRAVDGVILFAAPFYGDVVSLSDQLGCYRIHGRNDSNVGRLPESDSIRRDISRFVDRMHHLRKVIDRLDPDLRLVDPHDAFFFLDRSLYLGILSGTRPRLSNLPRLLWKLTDEPLSAKNMIAMAVFFLIASLLPNAKARSILAYRLKTGHRSILGFAKIIFARQN